MGAIIRVWLRLGLVSQWTVTHIGGLGFHNYNCGNSLLIWVSTNNGANFLANYLLASYASYIVVDFHIRYRSPVVYGYS